MKRYELTLRDMSSENSARIMRGKAVDKTVGDVIFRMELTSKLLTIAIRFKLRRTNCDPLPVENQVFSAIALVLDV